MVFNKVQTQFNEDNIDETIWKYLDDGSRSLKVFHTKQEIEEEVIVYMLQKLNGDVEFEKDDRVECFCENDLRKFLYKN